MYAELSYEVAGSVTVSIGRERRENEIPSVAAMKVPETPEIRDIPPRNMQTKGMATSANELLLICMPELNRTGPAITGSMTGIMKILVRIDVPQ